MAKKKNKKKTRQGKAADVRLEEFMDLMNLGVSESAEEEDIEMFGLVFGFVANMHKLAASAQGETTPGFEVLDESVQSCLTQVKRLRRV